MQKKKRLEERLAASEGDADFRELYEKCLASRLLKLGGQGCAGDAAGT